MRLLFSGQIKHRGLISGSVLHHAAGVCALEKKTENRAHSCACVSTILAMAIRCLPTVSCSKTNLSGIDAE